MYPRILVRLAAPLILTLLFPLAVAFDWPASVRWTLLTVMPLSWLAFAFYSARSLARPSPEQLAVSREQEALLTDLRHFVSNEISGSREEIGRARELIRDAVRGLGTSFDAMSR
ncbi:MAG TPA: chemotaxis protein, partial [Pseudoxanthomonas sp.]|nr:chemotaxis protein [Pseudoxanthomonas sp.]